MTREEIVRALVIACEYADIRMSRIMNARFGLFETLDFLGFEPMPEIGEALAPITGAAERFAAGGKLIEEEKRVFEELYRGHTKELYESAKTRQKICSGDSQEAARLEERMDYIIKDSRYVREAIMEL